MINMGPNKDIEEDQFGVHREIYNISTKNPKNSTTFTFININCKLGHVIGIEDYARFDGGPFIEKFNGIVERLVEIDKQHYQKMLFTAWLSSEKAIDRISEHFPLISKTTLPIGYNGDMHFCTFRFNLTKDYADIKPRLDEMMGLTNNKK